MDTPCLTAFWGAIVTDTPNESGSGRDIELRTASIAAVRTDHGKSGRATSLAFEQDVLLVASLLLRSTDAPCYYIVVVRVGVFAQVWVPGRCRSMTFTLRREHHIEVDGMAR